MPTGRLMTGGKLAFTTVDALLLHWGYAPTDFLQLNLSSVNPILLLTDAGERGLAWSAGGKLQVMKSDKILLGVALGFDVIHVPVESYYSYDPHDFSFSSSQDGVDEIFGIYPGKTSSYSYSTNIATSIGAGRFKGHLNIGALFFSRDYRGYDTESDSPARYFQYGIECNLGTTASNLGAKVMAEMFHPISGHGRNAPWMLVGVRLIRPTFAFDFAVLGGVDSQLFGRSNFLLPYFGLNFFI